ncbi:FIG01018693: hypothetical protein [hydrothermal vent metagenome]|uniref:OmpA-like domain-containing protein n=1 Tax=hydrothermal vent metagenome TaxID=652676 RepID=A0A3B0SVJ0_9ZZZZ
MKISVLFFLMTIVASHAQEVKSKADKYFYGYAYKAAIAEYKKDMGRGKLITNYQFLNLADSYFVTGDYQKASKIYLDINSKDTIMSNHRFNKMLQSLSKTSELERVRAFLKTKSDSLANELVENADFNFELLDSSSGNEQKFNVFNINGNSAQADFAPCFYKDKLLFSSGRTLKSKKMYGPSGESYLDIYIARIGSDGNVMNPNVFDLIPDSKYHKSTPHYSEGLEKVFYVLSNAENNQLSFDENGKNSLAIGMVYDNGFFGLLLKDLSTSFYYPFYEESTGKIYFAANFEDGYGGTDIYYVYTNEGQIMSEPVNLGPRINSPANEIAPFIIGESMYFSSDIFYGLGGMDIYKTNIRSDKNFSIPINLGSGINSSFDEFGFIIKSNEQGGFSGYFSSNREGGKGNDDIYGFKIDESLGPKTFSIKGKVIEPDYQQGIANATVKLLDDKGNVIKEAITRVNGRYQMEIPWREGVILEIAKDGHSSYYHSYTSKEMVEIQNIAMEVEMVSINDIVIEKEGKQVLRIPDFFFGRGKKDISPAIALELDKVVLIVQKFPSLQFRIESHTDSRGSSRTNKNLSQKRAEAIRSYLVQNGVPSERITGSLGYGEDHIINNCANGVYCLEFLHKQNLRTLFVVSNYDQLE